jgi:putative transposase
VDNDSKKLGNVISINEAEVKDHLGEIVRSTVEETLNGLLDAEADDLCGARRYERSAERVDTRAGSYQRSLETKAGKVSLKVPKLRKLTFETAIIERYRRRESSVEEALVQMYLAGVSVRRVEDITEALWGTRVSPSTVSDLNKKIYERIEKWRTRSLTGKHPYVYLDGLYLKRSWGGEVQSVAVLVAFGVNSDGYREILGVCEGAKEDKASWLSFLRELKRRGLSSTQLFISDKCLGLVEALGECFPEAKWQRCIVHYYRNVFSVVPKGKVKQVASMLKAIHAQEDLAEARKKAKAVVSKLKSMKLSKAAEMIADSIEETFTYYRFPREHWRRIRTNNPMERIMREVRRRTKVVGAFPDGQSALMLVSARLRHIAGTKWGYRRYLDMTLLKEVKSELKAS